MIMSSNPDSRQASSETSKMQYENSRPYLDDWGQPPASYFSFEISGGVLRGQRLEGPYVSFTSAEISIDLSDEGLRGEMSRWEALGINNLIDFEDNIEDNA
jgi:hypothetical protein